MNLMKRCHRVFGVLLLALVLTPTVASADLIDEEKNIYIVRPVITEPAWTQTGAYLKTFLFDMPDVISRPNAQVGFQVLPGLTWSVFGLLELNVGFPMVLNPDGQGVRDLDAADVNPALKERSNWDSTPDFDLPGLVVGLKAQLLGKKPADRVFLSVGALSNLPILEEWGTNYTGWTSNAFTTSPFVVSPYVAVAYGMGRFAPQLQIGYNLRFERRADPATGMFLRDNAGQIDSFQSNDLFFNLALPFAFPFEGTVPVLEVNGIVNLDNEAGVANTAQLFITPAVTFLPKGSSFNIGFACMIPVLDSAFRDHNGFRFLVNATYGLDFLGIPAADDAEGVAGASSAETPPASY